MADRLVTRINHNNTVSESAKVGGSTVPATAGAPGHTLLPTEAPGSG